MSTALEGLGLFCLAFSSENMCPLPASLLDVDMYLFWHLLVGDDRRVHQNAMGKLIHKMECAMWRALGLLKYLIGLVSNF